MFNVKKYKAQWYQQNKHKYKEQMKAFPWRVYYANARARCLNPKHDSFKYYGGRGILFRLTVQEVKELWFRDRAYALTWPSIDRINFDGDYVFSNCRFIEKSLNICRTKNVLRIDSKGEGTLFPSLSAGARSVGKSVSSIARCAAAKKGCAYGYRWEYAV